jgi:hypothetical protein
MAVTFFDNDASRWNEAEINTKGYEVDVKQINLEL